VAKISTIELSQLVPVKKERKPSARQIALQKREAEYERELARLEPGKAVKFEPTDEKLPALRASLQRVIDRNERRPVLHLAIISGIAYVAVEPIPGARRPRSKGKKAG
jgi:hypothetical protein